MKEKHKFNFFPEISAEDSKGLRESIAKGFDATLGKITLYEGKVLDGWNRYKACIDTGIEPVFTNFYGNDMEAFNFSVNANLDRRHLTSSQKAAMAVNAEPLLEAIEKANEEERRRKQAEAQRRIEAEKKALELLEFLGLSDRVNHKPNELSGGEQQRVAVARALINNPKLIFADEPSGNLDSESADQLHNLFFKLRDEFGQTFVIVTHNEELANMADRKLTMIDGKILHS